MLEGDFLPEDRVDIATLLENGCKTWTGKYFLCRSIIPAFHMVPGPGPGCPAIISIVAADPVGKRIIDIFFQNYVVSYPDGSNDKGICYSELPRDMFMVITNPIMIDLRDEEKAMGDRANNDKYIFCDNPMCVSLLSLKKVRNLFPDVKWSPLPPSIIENYGTRYDELLFQPFWAEDWSPFFTTLVVKRLGTEAFLKKRWPAAVRWYNMGLSECASDENRKTDIVDIASKKAAALLQMRCYDAALETVEQVLALDKKYVQGVYKKAKALLGLRKFEEAKTFLDEKMIEMEGLRDNEDLKVLRNSLRDTDTPNPNEVAEIISICIRSEAINTEKIQEYIGPVEVRYISDLKGRGLFATSDIPAGDLILIERAQTIFVYTKPSDRDYPMQHFVSHLANQVAFDPQLRKKILDLDHKPLPVNRDPPCNKGKDPFMQKLKYLCLRNATDIVCTDAEADEVIGKGLFITSSYINHSCSEANAFFWRVEDIKILRAFKRIKNGEQILVSYTPECYEPYHKREEKIYSSHAFKCYCKLCQVELRESLEITWKREKLVKKIAQLADRPLSYLLRKPKLIKQAFEYISTFASLGPPEEFRYFGLLMKPVVSFTILICTATFKTRKTSKNQESLRLLEKTYCASKKWSGSVYQSCQLAVHILYTHLVNGENDAVIKKWEDETKNQITLLFGYVNKEFVHVVFEGDRDSLIEKMRQRGCDPVLFN